MKLVSAIRKHLTVSILALVVALGLAGYGTAALLAPESVPGVADLFGLVKDPPGSGIEDGSV
jgi:hypothetical protein